MLIQTLSRRSSEHPEHNQDNHFLSHRDEYVVGAVLDGCSTGYNSEFASQTLAYLFESKADKIHSLLKDGFSFVNTCLYLFRDMSLDLENMKKMLGLTDMNFLSTIVFFWYNSLSKDLNLIFIGDGYVRYKIGDTWAEFDNDENNIPQYLAYHTDSFELGSFLKSRPMLCIENVTDFSVCTDGIHSLTVPQFTKKEQVHLDPKQFLLESDEFLFSRGLNNKANILLNREGYVIKDDLTIIRVKNETSV